MKRLIIVRHGNTFAPDQIPTRVGCHTDIPLVEKQLSKNIGQYLAQKDITIDHIFAAPLQRTIQTAQLIINELPQEITIELAPNFTEIDYGPDENQTEDIVIKRLGKIHLEKEHFLNPTEEEIIQAGKAILNRWNTDATVPFGWRINVEQIIENWRTFANKIDENETILVVSSNGIIRFSPHILGSLQYREFIQRHSIKVATGSLSIFENNGNQWECTVWNKRP